MRLTIFILTIALLTVPTLALDNIGGYYRETGYGYGQWSGGYNSYSNGGYGGWNSGYGGWNNGGCVNCPMWNVRTPVMSSYVGCAQPWARSVRPWTADQYTNGYGRSYW